MNKKLTLIIAILISWAGVASAQTLDAWLEAGNDAFRAQDYYSAYKYYGIALEYDESVTDTWYQYAESARKFDIYTKAESAYKHIINVDTLRQYPLSPLHLGEVLQKQGKYSEAGVMYNQFLIDNPSTADIFKEQATKGAEDCSWATEVIANADDIDIRNMSDTINSAYSDFSPYLKGDSLFYSSLKFVYSKDTIIPERPYSKLLISTNKSNSVVLPEHINVEGKHVGHTTFNADYSVVYYSICEYVEEASIRCDIYRSNISTEGHWSPAEKLSINQEGYTTTEPSLGASPDGSEVLYFASDRLGGKGKMDIWSVPVYEDGSLGMSTNMMSINTPETEITPFFSGTSQTLFFATDGYQTLGGLDIYKTQLSDSGWSDPIHMGAPINSSYDDAYYSVFDNEEEIYFASKRPDSLAIFWDETEETCCFDIYYYHNDKSIDLNVFAFNSLNKYELEGVTVELIEILPDGSEVVVDSKVNELGNSTNFKLYPNKKYKIRGSKDGFSKDIAMIDMKDPALKGVETLEKKLYLEPGVNLLVTTYDNLDSLALNGVTVQLYEITPEGEVLIEKKTNESGNDFNFTLARNKKYVIKGMKDGFPTVMNEIDLTTPEMQEVQTVERKLYLGQELEALTFDDNTKEILKEATIELYEIENGVRTLVGKKTNMEGNQFLFPLDLSKSYEITASRKGYESFSQEFTLDPELVKEAGGRVTIEIYLKRSGWDDYLPITLYFDNDYPNPRSRLSTTDSEYITTNKEYYSKKKEFVESFTEGLDQENKYVISRNFNNFFDRDVRGARRDLEDFAEELLTQLEGGSGFTVKLQGYASPRASASYNERLSKRRIESVKNFFKEYEGGAFTKYINNGHLKFKEEAFGESKSPGSVSDLINDRKNSVYSLVASVERRVEIVEVELIED